MSYISQRQIKGHKSGFIKYFIKTYKIKLYSFSSFLHNSTRSITLVKL